MPKPWEVDNPFQQAPRTIPIGPRDPRPAEQLRGNQLGNEKTAMDNRITNATMDAIIRKAVADAQKAEADARKAEADAAGQVKPEDMAAVRAEAINKLNLLSRMQTNADNGWFPTTGFGAGVSRDINGTAAHDIQSDIDTVGAAGALTRVMELARQNGGKNPLTPLSESDFTNIGKSVTNLDQTQSRGNWDENIDVYRNIYRRAYQGAGGDPRMIDPSNGAAQQGVNAGLGFAADVASQARGMMGGRQQPPPRAPSATT